MGFFKIVPLFVGISLCFFSYAFAKSEPEFDKVEVGELIVQDIYEYKVQYYKQPLKLHAVEKKEYKFFAPEQTLIALISAMSRGDIHDLEGWDSVSSKKIAEKLRNQEFAKKAERAWKDNYVGADFYLLRRVDRKDMIILDYMAKKGSQEYRNTLNFRNEEGKWKATNIFAGDYVSNYLNAGEATITGNVDW